MQEVNRINQRELEMGGDGSKGSWHDEYKGANTQMFLTRFTWRAFNAQTPVDSAYIYVGGLPDGITEGDLITICSQCVTLLPSNHPSSCT